MDMMKLGEAKAHEIGCDNTNACSHLSLSPNIIDAIRSGANIELEIDEEIVKRTIYEPKEVDEAIRTVKHKVTRLQDKCVVCGKVAEEERHSIVEGKETDKKFIFLKCGHLIIREIPKETPFHLLKSNDGRSPYPFQVDGMRAIEAALATGRGFGVFDEMGLGKTVQVDGYINFYKEQVKPVCFAVKSASKYQQLKELYRWTGEVAQIIEKSTDIVLPMFDYYIISYDLLVPKTKKMKSGKIVQSGFDVQKLIDRGIKLLILDECQQIKNVDASRTQQIRKLAATCKVIGTSGTPWKNRGSEFYSILNMIDPVKFPSYAGYLRRWVKYYAQGNQWKEGGINDIPAFKEYIKDIAIRREVDEVFKQMPPVNRTIFTCDLDEFTREQYEDEVSEFVRKQNQKIIDGTDDSGSMEVVGDLMRMRHIVGLSKIPVTVEWAREFYENTEDKLVVFVEHIDVGQILFETFKKEFPDAKVINYTGSMNSEQKWNAQETFNTTQRCFMIASTRAAGEAINLQTGCTAIMHERQWNPANEDQAAPGRFRRIGQERPMNIVFITAKGTTDEFMATLVEEKRANFHNLMNKGEAITWNEGSILKELVNMIVQDHNKKNRKKAS